MVWYKDERFDFDLLLSEQELKGSICSCIPRHTLSALEVGFHGNQKNFYFDHSAYKTGKRVHFSFNDSKVGRDVYADVKSHRLVEGLTAPIKVISSPRSVLSDLISGPGAARLFEDFSETTTPILLKWGEEIAEGRRNIMSLVFDLMTSLILIKGADQEDYPAAFLTYKSHADGFFIMSNAPDMLRDTFEKKFNRISVSAQDRIKELKRQLDSDSLPDDIANWRSVLHELQERAFQSIQNGEIYFSSQGTGYMGDSNDLSGSSFHQTIQGSRGFQNFMRKNPSFLTTRIVIGFQYLSFHRLGLPLIDRYFTCYSIASSIEKIYDVDSQKALENFLVKSLTPKYFGVLLSPFIHLIVKKMPKNFG